MANDPAPKKKTPKTWYPPTWSQPVGKVVLFAALVALGLYLLFWVFFLWPRKNEDPSTKPPSLVARTPSTSEFNAEAKSDAQAKSDAERNTIREMLSSLKSELQAHPENMSQASMAFLKDPTVRRLKALLGFYRHPGLTSWTAQQSDTIGRIAEHMIYKIPAEDILANLDEIELSQFPEAQNAALRRIAGAHFDPPPLREYAYFLYKSSNATVQYAAMYGLSKSQLKDSPGLAAYANYMKDPAPVVAAWQDYLSAHLIVPVDTLTSHSRTNQRNDYPPPYQLALTLDRTYLLIGEKAQIILFLRKAKPPSPAKSDFPPEPIKISTDIFYEPKTAGHKTLGPYEVDFQGHHLKSNTVDVDVNP